MSSLDSLAPPSLTSARPSTPLANQVAGHQNVMSDESGSLVIKPALPREIAFYQLLSESPRNSPLRRLKPFVPKFFGTLRLEGRLDPSSQTLNTEIPEKKEIPESVVLENLAHAYTHPNILDAKLGNVLYSPEATEEKKSRMEKQARESTSFETGLRLTGCQAWHHPSQTYILTPKSFGKSISIDQLPSGMIRYFPLPNDSIPSMITPPSPPPSTSTSEVFPDPTSLPLAPPVSSTSTVPTNSIGITPIPPNSTNSPATTNSSSSLNPGSLNTSTSSRNGQIFKNHSIPPSKLLRVLELIDTQLSDLEIVLSDLEMRFIGASVLVVYEGDPERLSQALERMDSKPLKPRNKTFIDPVDGIPVVNTGGSSDDSDFSGEDTGNEEEDEEDDEEDDDSLDGTRADEKIRQRCPPTVVKMIDFAHTWLAEGEGPDIGVLKGLGMLRKLVRGRIGEVRLAMDEEK